LPKSRKTVGVSRRDAKLYLAKAQQFLDEAQLAEKASRDDAAMLNAIHAAISAADSVTIVLAGRRSSDRDHRRAVDLLMEVGAESESIAARAKQLSVLISKKQQVEYESRRATSGEAADAVSRASRIVDWAREIVSRARV
jgi:HEPN domain-containing protein